MAQNLLHNNTDTVAYSYDIRNMLTETHNKHFSERLYYADNPSATACYNGNISAARVSQADTSFTFYYTYDFQNRLVESQRDHRGQKRPCEWFQYDSRGNITALQRYNVARLIDNLTFTYQKDGNLLLSVEDDGTDANKYEVIEYIDRHEATTDEPDMQYDANGNLISDADRGISVIHYNILNLPDTIQFTNGNQIVNLYDAAGNKYKSIAYTVPSTTVVPHYEIVQYSFEVDTIAYLVTAYDNNIETIYTRDDTLARRINNGIGYKLANTYFHYHKDHLGNINVVVDSEADTLVQSTIYYASGVPMAQSFGRNKQPYLYNGKEFVEMHGLDEYDSKARWYYPTIMRTTTMDPLAEKYYHLSPYAWCGNNPINIIDLDGRKWKNKKDAKIAQRIAGKAHSNIGKQLKRINKLQTQRLKSKSAKRQASLDRQIADCQNQIIRLKTLEQNIDLLTNRETVYSFKTLDNTKKAYLEKDDDGTIVINNFGSDGSKAHEITHAAQYEKKLFTFEKTSKISYPKDNDPTLLIFLEIEAYQTEYSIDGCVTAKPQDDQPETSLDIDYDWVSGIQDPEGEGSFYNPSEYKPTNPSSGIFMPWKKEPEKLGL